MNWITKIIKAGEKIKSAIHKRASKEDIANSNWTSCCKGPILKKDLEKKKLAKEIFEKLKNKQFTIKKLSTENNELYGSVKPTEISKVILDENIVIFLLSRFSTNNNPSDNVNEISILSLILC